MRDLGLALSGLLLSKCGFRKQNGLHQQRRKRSFGTGVSGFFSQILKNYAGRPDPHGQPYTGQGKKTVLEDLPAVVKKIEHWHQGSIARFEVVIVSPGGAETIVGPRT